MLAQAILEGQELATKITGPLEIHLLPEVAGVVLDYDSRSYRLFERRLLISLWTNPAEKVPLLNPDMLRSNHPFSKRFISELDKRDLPNFKLLDKLAWVSVISGIYHCHRILCWSPTPLGCICEDPVIPKHVL